MSLSNSPSLNEYKNGIPDKPKDHPGRRKAFRIILSAFLVLSAVLLIYSYLQSDAASLLVGKGSLTGQVVDEQGNVLNARVFVMGVDRPVDVRLDGSFTYGNIPAGERSLVIAYNGTAAEYSVLVKAGTTIDVGRLIFKVVTPVP
jgi:hypothetical protein